jgi:hypothetical protein
VALSAPVHVRDRDAAMPGQLDDGPREHGGA